MAKQIKPPFTLGSAKEKIQRAEDLWNGKNPEAIALAYTPECKWRNRNEFIQGRTAIAQLLKRKWNKELNYTLKKELFTFSDDKISVHFQYEYHDDNNQWYRAYGNENWHFDSEGLMQTRDASINEMPIKESDRLFK
ncbi:nuclear transport factor 2 family protein [Pseudoalteromonas denitrificans]|uniref:DUF4440 domain-containing protein n=1 Tax=Pseudoalteromonas denitrificans DSM 6059 TaxID=1123010 RepID=A0A1I1P4E1_9GAMM|nr:nuclear transport factor 2 family protein [Pseudoalteromonas denitrificans]SFD04811.1 hypothetical protein SAMN02745724_03308 [Pseudoalteromonas denitrificans DSM 6059]